MACRPKATGDSRDKMMMSHVSLRRLFGVSDFKKLQVWQKAHALSLTVDRVSKEIRGSH